jgi:PAS domain S-box-containing protein
MSHPSSETPKPRFSPAGKPTAEVFLSNDLLEALPDAVIAVDHTGTILDLNSQVLELFGYDYDELMGQKVEILVPDRYRRQHRNHRDDFSQAPKTRRMGADLELYGRRHDGSQFPVEISLSPVPTRSGIVVLSAIRDITDRKRIAEELRRANEELQRRTTEQLGEYRARLASIIDSSEDAIIGKDLQGNITSWNRGAEKIYGYTPEEVVGKNISLLAPNARPDEIPEILRKIARGESIEHRESVRVTKDGREHVHFCFPVARCLGHCGGSIRDCARHNGAKTGRETTQSIAEDGSSRPARWRVGARLQQPSGHCQRLRRIPPGQH